MEGRDVPYSRITISFLQKTYVAGTDESGVWKITLDPAEPGGPYVLAIYGTDTTEKLIEDIYIGDVWLCSGQSNMELPMARLKDEYPEEWNPPVNPLIREFRVPIAWDFGGPRDALSGGEWLPAAPETLDSFSGTAYFFAKKLFEKHPIPQGLIVAAVGGAPIESLMSKEALAAFPHKIAEGEKYADPQFRERTINNAGAAVNSWEAALKKNDRGLAEGWYDPGLDDSSWEEMHLPSWFSSSALGDFCGVLWFRKTITIPPGCPGGEYKLWLGTIVDADRVYWNGAEIGCTTYRYPPRKYAVDAVRKGENQLCLRIVCNNGNGGFTPGKPFHLFSADHDIELGGIWKYKIGFTISPRPADFFIQWKPMGLFNAMIAPVLNYPVRGILWYQGESNADRSDQAAEYAALFTALIQDWREKKAAGRVPFLFVQLPLFGVPEENSETGVWAMMREAQGAALVVPVTGMAVALDLGEWNDLHPVLKKEVGYRLALAAEAVVYGEKNSAPGPQVYCVERRDNTLVVKFSNCGAGLRANSPPYVSIVAGVEAVRIPAVIKDGDTLLADLSGIKNPEKLLYAWADNPADRQISNADGLPMIPFRITIPRT
ncbi:9-O-acetylesterase [Spirochaetia bacterium]|nr:9-O-acetylesterase [Spirochaetia bacterium]